MAISLLEAGLAKLQTSFGSDRIPDIHLLEKAEQAAKKQKLKVRSRIQVNMECLYVNFLIDFLFAGLGELR